MSESPNKSNITKSKSLFNFLSQQKVEAELTKQMANKDHYIELLEQVLRDNGLELPVDETLKTEKLASIVNNLLQQGTAEEIQILINNQKHLIRTNVAQGGEVR